MIISSSLTDFQNALALIPKDCAIGFVPTMGALHQGHISLVTKALTHTKYIIVSIFVNPTQFNNSDDLARYPRTIEADCKKLEDAGAYLVFIPSVQDIYPHTKNPSSPPETQIFDLGGLDITGEGPRRPGHFNGVVQVVTRLFDIVKPAYAFFGEKDFQQLAIIKYVTEKQGYPVKIIACPTLREADGLAMSSRNALLTEEKRMVAPKIYQILKTAQKEFTSKLTNIPSAETHQSYTVTPSQLTKWVTDEINSETLFKSRIRRDSKFINFAVCEQLGRGR